MGAAAVVTVHNKLGLHTRPAKEFVQTANRFEAKIEVAKGGGVPVNGKSIMGLMSLLVPQGTEIRISAEGPDAQQAVDALCELVRQRFGEEE